MTEWTSDEQHAGHIRAGGVGKAVTFVDADPSINDQIDAAYRAKYRRGKIINDFNSPSVRSEPVEE